MPAVGTRYTSVQTFKTDATYVCARCGFTSPVNVLGLGSASASASHLLGNHAAARSAAVEGAQATARADVARMLRLVPCPSCGRRAPLAGLLFWTWQAAKLAGVLLVVTFGAVFIFGQLGLSGFLIACAIAWALTIALYLFVTAPLFEWRRASSCVKFTSPDAAPEDPERVFAALRAAIETIASRHQHPPSQEALERVRACKHEDTLRRWAMQAAMSQSLDDVLNGH